MADPLSIIGSGSALICIIGGIGKTVSTLHYLRERWKEANFTFFNLIAQLTALKAALTQIQGWVDETGEEIHPQLVMDLELSTVCCRMLVNKIDAEISGLHQVSESKLNRKSKLKFLANKRELEELQKLVERQTSALTRLLVACNCKTVSDRKTSLEIDNREVFKTTKDNTSSLHVHRDNSSIYSLCTDNLSKVSVVFQFDRELFVSKVYERALRGSFRETLMQQKRIEFEPKKREKIQNKLSGTIERMSEVNARERRQSKILLLGSSESGKEELVRKMMRMNPYHYTDEEISSLQLQLMITGLQVMRQILCVAIQFMDQMEIDIKPYVHQLSEALGTIDEMNYTTSKITSTAMAAMTALWGNSQFAGIIAQETSKDHLSKATPYILANLLRITSKDYQPTEEDFQTVTRPGSTASSIIENRCTIGSLDLRVLDTGCQALPSEKKFEGVSVILFTVDLCFYKKEAAGILLLFDSVVNSKWFIGSSVILLLTNVRKFPEKLASNPLEGYFPDYTGGNDANKAAKYILWRFNQRNRARVKLCPYLVEVSDSSNLQLVVTAIKEAIVYHELRKGILY